MARSRRALDRDRIVDAALELVDERGIDELSMRALARRLETGPMSLYRHVSGKEELVTLVVAALTARLTPGDPGQRWDEAVADVFRRIRCLLAAYPGVAVHLADEAIMSPANLEISEYALDALARAGLDAREGASAFTALWTFTVGSALVEQMLFAPRLAGGADGDQRHRVSERIAETARGRYPRLERFAPHWEATTGVGAFEEGLTLMLEAIRARVDGRAERAAAPGRGAASGA